VLRKLVYAGLFFTAFGVFVIRAVNTDALSAPPDPGDGHDYDAIAFNIWQGRGFGYYWSDPAWRRPYEQSRRYRPVLRRQSDFYPTTYRPPAMPYLLSAVYAVTGRNFAAWRLLNCAFAAGAVTTAALMSAQFAGIPAAILTTGLALSSPRITHYSQRFLTEVMAAFLVTLVAWVWMRNSREGWKTRGTMVLGALLGALIATRSIFVLSVPLVILVAGHGAGDLRRILRTKAICLLMVLVVIGPWWIRNIVVTNTFMPLGTQGGINLPMGFGPRALKFQGIWRSNPEDGWSEISAMNLGPVESEVQLAKRRTSQTLTWMREHPSDVLRLMWSHMWQEVRPRGNGISDWLLPAAVVGMIVLRKLPGMSGVIVLVCANLAGVAMTYSHLGRFMVPLEPLLAAVVGAGVVTLARHAVPRRWDRLARNH